MRKRMQVGNVNSQILTGQADLSTWTNEELIRGQRRNKNGGWTGRPPTVVPKAVHNELVRRQLGEAGDLLRESLVDAVGLLRNVVNDKRANDSDRIKAANIIVERVLGKAPEFINVEMQQAPPWQLALEAGVVSVKRAELPGSEED